MISDMIGYDHKIAIVGIIGQILAILMMLFVALGGILGLIFPRRGLLSEHSLSMVMNIGAVALGGLGIWMTLKMRNFATFRVGFKLCYYCSKNKYDKALKSINKKIDSNYLGYKPNWLNMKAMILIDKEELDKAQKILEDLEKEYPNFLQMLHYRACLESKKGNIEKSEEYLKKLYEVQQKWLDQIKNPLSKWNKKRSFKNYTKRLENHECFENLRKKSDINRIILMFSKLG